MTAVQVNATERFNEISLSTEILDGRATPFHTLYTCPKCAEKVSFSRTDFESRGRHQTSNLSEVLSFAISAFAQESGIGADEYLDWYCPKCRLPTRAYFRQWAGGRHGDSGIDIISVVVFQETHKDVL